MKGFVFSRLTQTDLDDIWDYTARAWHAGQAERYVSEIRRAVDQLVDGKRISRSADDVGPEYRKLRVNSHVIFYRVDHEMILVVRVLHEKMDFRSHIVG